MQLTDYSIENTWQQFGNEGANRIQRLPYLLAQCQERWRLTGCFSIDKLTINLVCYAQSEIHGEVVLKLESPNNERNTEMIAFRLFEGRYVW